MRQPLFIAVVMGKWQEIQLDGSWGKAKPIRWRTHKSLALALFHGRRNLKTGKFVWIEKEGQPATLGRGDGT